MKIAVTFEDLKILTETSKKVGTLNSLIDLMLDWAKQAEQEINRLTKLLKEKEQEINRLTKLLEKERGG